MKSFAFGKSKINIIGGRYESELIVIGTVDTVVLYFVRFHDGSGFVGSFFRLFVLLVGLLVVEVVLKLSFLLLEGL
jgi:hypothetical protein